MDQLRPPLPQRLRPAHWVGIDCAVTAVMALAYALIFRETADLRGIPYWAGPAVVAVTVLPVMRALRTSKRFGTRWLRRIGGWRAWHARTRRERW